jgi:hypothetical protein
MPRARVTIDQELASALYAEYGTQARAAAAAGVPRSTFYDALIGRFEGRATPRTAGAVERAANELGDTVVGAIRGLIRSLAGGQASEAPRVTRQLAREQRGAPGVVRERAGVFQRGMAALGLTPQGTPLPSPTADLPAVERPEFNRLGRRITDGQWQAYQELEAARRAGTLNQEQYGRLLALHLGSGSGGTGVPIAPLPGD